MRHTLPLGRLIRATFAAWWDDKAPRLGAALAFYTVFSLAPVLIIVIAVAGAVFGQEAAAGQIYGELRGLLGPEGAIAVQKVVESSRLNESGALATVIGVVTFVFGATVVFAELQDALNTIWRVQPPPGLGIGAMLKGRLLSFALVLGLGFILLVSLSISAGLNALHAYVSAWMPNLPLLWEATHQLVSLGLITVLMALIYKVLPDVRISWRDVWTGAAITAVLFTLGKILIGLYLGQTSLGSTYGAAGSIIVLLLWVYYSAMVLFLGAEFTKLHAQARGAHNPPERGAVPVEPRAG